jgi:hypothetical protein
MLSNLETEKSKLIQIVLVGQPSLRDLLARPELEQLRQRVTVSYHLQALDPDDTAAYVSHRLRKAALGAPLEFPRPVTDLIHQHSHGVPRTINVIADAVLLFGYGEERRVIDVDLTVDAIAELVATGVIGGPSSAAAPGPVETVQPATAEDPGGAEGPGSVEGPGSADRRMTAREVALAEREQRIAERERVLLEGYRRLSSQAIVPAAPRASVPPERPTPEPPRPPSQRVALPPRRADAGPPAPGRRAPSSYQARQFASRPVPQETFWLRLRRQVADAFKPVVED